MYVGHDMQVMFFFYVMSVKWIMYALYDFTWKTICYMCCVMYVMYVTCLLNMLCLLYELCMLFMILHATHIFNVLRNVCHVCWVRCSCIVCYVRNVHWKPYVSPVGLIFSFLSPRVKVDNDFCMQAVGLMFPRASPRAKKKPLK